MSKKTLYLHVGPHKTGTTVIQKACLDNKDVLEKYNISYPSVFFEPIAHHKLVNMVRGRDVSDEDLAKLAEGDSDILLSSENFIHFTAPDWKYIRERFSMFDVKIIYAWRRSSLKMYSMWQESVKHGGTEPFHHFFYKDLIRPGQSRSLMQALNIDMFASVFGKESVSILDFDALSEDNSLVTEFFNLIGVDGAEIDISKQNKGFKNESLDPETTEILRCLNALSLRAGHSKSSKTRELFSSYQTSINTEVEQIKILMNSYLESVNVGGYFVDRATEKAMKDKYLSNVISYQNKERIKEIKLVNQDWLLEPSASELLSIIHKKMMQ